MATEFSIYFSYAAPVKKAM